ncbi:MAG: amidohydrolase family protein, partial [Proteobacteria bacterium]|nr:amidohydrolase family protein [Pseudomonadota bacterium]
TRYHVLPPLRSLSDRDALREGVSEGVIDAICSDHQPHGLDAKLAPFSESEPGIAGLETLLSLTLQLVLDGVISLPEAISRVTFNPACILGIDVGRLSPGAPADVCIFNPSLKRKINVGDFYSQGRNSPFDDSSLAGQVTAVIVAGKVVSI